MNPTNKLLAKATAKPSPTASAILAAILFALTTGLALVTLSMASTIH